MKRSALITIISVFLISLSLIATLLLNDSLGSRIVEIVTVITAIVGAVALYIQFKKDKELNAARFLIDYSKSFYGEYNLSEIFKELDKHYVDPNYEFDYEKFRPQIVAYLEWIESLASLVEMNVMDLYTMDNIISYRFFIIVNNKQVQENELVKYAIDYRGTYFLYDKWFNYEKRRGLSIPLEQNGLHLTKDYGANIKMIKEKIFTKK